MNTWNKWFRHTVGLFGPLVCSLVAQAPPSPPALSPKQLDSLVAPVALYPDSLLSQVLVASTYPLEIVEADPKLVSGSFPRQNRNDDHDF